MYRKLPTDTTEEGRKTTNVRLALRFADELATDGCEKEARTVREGLLEALLDLAIKKNEDSQLVRSVAGISEITYRTVRVENGELQDNSKDEIKQLQIIGHVDDLFRKCFVVLTDDLAKGYVAAKFAKTNDEYEVWRYKLEAVVLSQDRAIFQRMEDIAGGLFDHTWQELLPVIQELPDERHAEYQRLLRVSKRYKQDIPIIPDPIRLRLEKGAVVLQDHLFVDSEGLFRAKLTSWESTVLAGERQRDDFFCFLRNYPKKQWSIGVVYKDAAGKAALSFRDFIVFRKLRGRVVADLLEPHWGENSRKAKGLCEFVDRNPTTFPRVQFIRVLDGDIPRRLDLTKKQVRERILALQDNDSFVLMFDDSKYTFSETKV